MHSTSIAIPCSFSGGGGGGEEECDPPCDNIEYVCVEGYCSNCSPIVIDVLGNGFDLSDAPDGVDFDLNADSIANRISWTRAGSDDAWLVLDRDDNEMIDDGTELFGTVTSQPASDEPNGFLALAEFDDPAKGGNDDGRIDKRDAVFPYL